MTDAEDRPCTAKKLTSPSVSVPPVSISNVTKRSFQQTTDSPLTADMSGNSSDVQKTSSIPVPRQPLLPKRLQQNQMNNSEGDGNLHQSGLAWQDSKDGQKQARQYSSLQSQLTSVTTLSDTSTNSSNLLGNVSIDSELSMDFTESSVDISAFEDSPRRTPVGPIHKTGGALLSGPGHPDHLELQSVTPAVSSRLSEHNNTGNPHSTAVGPMDNKNPQYTNLITNISSSNPHGGNLQGGNPHGGNPHGGNPHGGNSYSGNPHGGNPQGGNPNGGNQNSGNPFSADVYSSSHNPQGGNPGIGKNPQERGSESQAEKLMPAHLKPAKEKLNNSHTKEVESGEATAARSPTSPSKQPPKSLNILPQVNSIVMGGNESDGSTPDEDYQTPSTESVPLPGEVQKKPVDDAAAAAQSKPCLSESGQAEPKRRQYEAFYVDPDSSLSSNIPLGHGLRGVSSQTPVTESFVLHDQHHTVESAMAAGLPVVDVSTGRQSSEHGSGDSSDPELQKLRADHQMRETQGSPKPAQVTRPESLAMKDGLEKVQKKNDEESPKTSFAQIKQEKENGGNRNQEVGFSLKSQFQKGRAAGKVQKKTTFAALPNQTTWQENAVSATRQRDSNRKCLEGDMSPTSSELIDIKMRLEERRRQIENEKRRMEMQWTKQRQRLGKQAFIQVINRGKSESDLHQVKDEEVSSDGRKAGKALDHDERLSSLIKSQSVKTEDGSPALLKGSSAPASREQSLDREQSVPSPAVSKTKKPAKSQVAKADKVHAVPSSCEKLTRSADSAKELFSEDEPVITRLQTSPVKARPKSYHAPDTSQPKPATTSVTSKPEPSSGQSSLTSSTEKPNLGNYSTSLDRLNSSLSELQGEIMRLSLQQDQIKSMVVHEREPAKTSQSPVPAQAAPSNHDDKYYLYPRNAVGEPDIISAKTESAPPVPTPAQATQPSSVACIAQPVYAPSQQPTQLAGVHYANQAQPPYGTMPSYPAQFTPFVGNHPQPPGLYTLPQQYTGMPQPHYQATNIYQTPQMYQQQIPGFSGMPHGQWHPGVPPITQPAPSGQSPYSNNTFQPVLQPHSMTSVQSPIQRTTGTPDFSPDHHYKTPSGYTTVTSGSPGHNVMAQTVGQSQVPLGLPSPVQPPAISSPAAPSTPPVPGVVSKPDNPDIDQQQMVGEPQPERFFVGLEETSLDSHSKKSKDTGLDTPAEDVDKTAPESGSAFPQYIDASPVGFVIGEEPDVNVELSEMEKKRQRLFELQMKRREEQERKRLKKEQEMAKKREEQQAKQEQLERKKAEEKMRREAIFQEYLKRKEQESGEDEPKPAAAVQKRAHSKSRSKTVRPKSQPAAVAAAAAAAVEDTPAASSMISSSGAAPAVPPEQSVDKGDEDRKSPSSDIGGKQTGHLMTFPVAPGNGEQTDTNYQQLAFGGLTHRRPPTPERPTRLFLDNSSDSSSNPSSSDYTGPKLFKKPSQKSNRHIIVNAISHCCLAGTVNTAVKDKVLDIISKSDAKHFVILFRDAGQQFKALYTYDPEREEVLKIHGVGPKQLTDDMMERFYKYNSGAKSFTEVTSTKHLSATIDAVVIHNHFWQKKTSTTKRAPNQY